MNTTIIQIIQMDTYHRGGAAQAPNERGEIEFALDAEPTNAAEGTTLHLNPLTGACRINERKLTDGEALVALGSVHSALFNAAKANVRAQHEAAARRAAGASS